MRGGGTAPRCPPPPAQSWPDPPSTLSHARMTRYLMQFWRLGCGRSIHHCPPPAPAAVAFAVSIPPIVGVGRCPSSGCGCSLCVVCSLVILYNSAYNILMDMIEFWQQMVGNLLTHFPLQ
jgi:hypothetical protein